WSWRFPSNCRRPDRRRAGEPLWPLLRPHGAGPGVLVDSAQASLTVAAFRDSCNVRATLWGADLASRNARLPLRMAALPGGPRPDSPPRAGDGNRSGI